MSKDLEAFLRQLRTDKEARNGPGIYASDKVFMLLEELDKFKPAAYRYKFGSVWNWYISGNLAKEKAKRIGAKVETLWSKS